MNRRQVKQFLKQKKLQPLKKYGQNFLINPAVIQNIVTRVQRHPAPFVEIGPGLGSLTQCFASNKENIILVERDKRLLSYWEEAGYFIFCADALKLNWTKLPKKFTLFGNLPYEIAASLIVKSCLYQKQIQSMIFMVQKEVAQRITAKPSSKDYGLLSVISQVFWDIYLVANVSKTDFYPIPKVDGRVLEFQIKENKLQLEADLFLKFVKKCFSFKRKMLFKQIDTLPCETAKKTLKSLGLSETCRAEELLPGQFVELYLQVREKNLSR